MFPIKVEAVLKLNTFFYLREVGHFAWYKGWLATVCNIRTATMTSNKDIFIPELILQI